MDRATRSREDLSIGIVFTAASSNAIIRKMSHFFGLTMATMWNNGSNCLNEFIAGIVSLISLAVLSYERYSTLTLCNKRSDDYRKALLAVGGSWVYSLLWTVPPLLGWSSYGIEGAGTSCSVRWSSETAESTSYIICLFIFCLVIPVMVMMYCYGRLLYAVKQVSCSILIVQTALRNMLNFSFIDLEVVDDRQQNHKAKLNRKDHKKSDGQGKRVFSKILPTPEAANRTTREHP